MKHIVIQTDFGTGSASVSAMHGVCAMVCDDLKVSDGNNDVNQFDVLDASGSLVYLLPYWPEGTVFVSVVDPGVGTARKSCVALTENGQYIVTPDNGTLTYVKENIGIKEVREIDESVNRLPGSESVHIFHGRDVYAYCGARLAAGIIDFEGVGPAYDTDSIVMADYIRPAKDDHSVSGMIVEASDHFGLVGTNIPFEWLQQTDMKYGDELHVTVEHAGETVMDEMMPLEKSFGFVPVGTPLLFSSETQTVMLAINRGNAVTEYGLGFGPEWKMTVEKLQSSKAAVVIHGCCGLASTRAAKLVGIIETEAPDTDAAVENLCFDKNDIRMLSASLYSAVPFWPAGTVFLYDTGDEELCAVRLKSGQILLGPNDGSCTMSVYSFGLDSARRVDPKRFGTDEYAIARAAGHLAAGKGFENLGSRMECSELKQFHIEPAEIAPGVAKGQVAVLLKTFGNITFNIGVDEFEKTGIQQNDEIEVTITYRDAVVYRDSMTYQPSFGYVEEGAPVVFNGSSGYMDIGLNRANFIEMCLPKILREPDPGEFKVCIRKKGA